MVYHVFWHICDTENMIILDLSDLLVQYRAISDDDTPVIPHIEGLVKFAGQDISLHFSVAFSIIVVSILQLACSTW